MKTISCRSHGGTFEIQPKRGRQPVRCTADNPCTRVDAEEQPNKQAKRPPNRNVTLAKQAKEKLVALGWTAKGQGSTEYAELHATRGDERLVLRWEGGKLTGQDYSIFNEETTPEEMPADKLSVDPHNLTDEELVKWIRGAKVTWWNSIGHSHETHVVGNKVTVQHVFDPETPPQRIVTFVSRDAGFRSFNVNALLKVG